MKTTTPTSRLLDLSTNDAVLKYAIIPPRALRAVADLHTGQPGAATPGRQI